MPFKELFTTVAAVATWGHKCLGKSIRFHTDSHMVAEILSLRQAQKHAVASPLQLLYWYSALYDCKIGAIHIMGIDNNKADAISQPFLLPGPWQHSCRVSGAEYEMGVQQSSQSLPRSDGHVGYSPNPLDSTHLQDHPMTFIARMKVHMRVEFNIFTPRSSCHLLTRGWCGPLCRGSSVPTQPHQFKNCQSLLRH